MQVYKGIRWIKTWSRPLPLSHNVEKFFKKKSGSTSWSGSLPKLNHLFLVPMPIPNKTFHKNMCTNVWVILFTVKNKHRNVTSLSEVNMVNIGTQQAANLFTIMELFCLAENVGVLPKIKPHTQSCMLDAHHPAQTNTVCHWVKWTLNMVHAAATFPSQKYSLLHIWI